MIYLSLVWVVFSWYYADQCETYSFAWWMNMFASALNFVIFCMFV